MASLVERGRNPTSAVQQELVAVFIINRRRERRERTFRCLINPEAPLQPDEAVCSEVTGIDSSEGEVAPAATGGPHLPLQTPAMDGVDSVSPTV